VSAHRRSTLRLADRIAVMHEGRLGGEGSHEELLAPGPLSRLLLAGPGDDAEGIDAGELDSYQNVPAGREPGTASPGLVPAAVARADATQPAAVAGADATQPAA